MNQFGNIVHFVGIAPLLLICWGCMSPKRVDWAVRTEADRSVYRVTRNASLFHCKQFVENGQRALDFFYQFELWPTFLPAVQRDFQIWWTGISNDTAWLVNFYAQNAYLALMSNLSAGITDPTAKMNMEVCLMYAEENYFKKGMAYMFREQAQNVINIVKAKDDPAEWRPFMQPVRDALDVAGNGSIYLTEHNRTLWTNRFGEWLQSMGTAMELPRCKEKQMLDSWFSTPSNPDKVELPKSLSDHAEYLLTLKNIIEEIAQHVYNVIMKHKSGWDNDPNIIAPEFTKADELIGQKARDESDWDRFLKLMTERLRAEQIINQKEIDGAVAIMRRERPLPQIEKIKTEPFAEENLVKSEFRKTESVSVEETKEEAADSWKIKVSKLADEFVHFCESTNDEIAWMTQCSKSRKAIVELTIEAKNAMLRAEAFFIQKVNEKLNESKTIDNQKQLDIKNVVAEMFEIESQPANEEAQNEKLKSKPNRDEH